MVVRKILDGASLVGIQFETQEKVIDMPSELKDDVYYTPFEDCIRYGKSIQTSNQKEMGTDKSEVMVDNWLDALLEVPESDWMRRECRPDLVSIENPSDLINELDGSFLGKKYIAKAFKAMNDMVGCLISVSKCVDDPGMVGGVLYSMSFDTLFECMRFVKYFYEVNPELEMKYCRVLSDSSSVDVNLANLSLREWLELALKDLKTNHNAFKKDCTLEDDLCFTFMGGTVDIEVISGRVVAVVNFNIE